jgi:hypothetical protein
MEERIVIGSRTFDGWVKILFKGDSQPTFAGRLDGRELPKAGQTVTVVNETGKDDKQYVTYYW